MERDIATGSVEDGLDFAGNLLVDSILARASAHPEESGELLRGLGQYVRFRYGGESVLALECLTALAHSSHVAGARAAQVWAQLRWLAEQTLTPDDQLGLPGAVAD